MPINYFYNLICELDEGKLNLSGISFDRSPIGFSQRSNELLTPLPDPTFKLNWFPCSINCSSNESQENWPARHPTRIGNSALVRRLWRQLLDWPGWRGWRRDDGRWTFGNSGTRSKFHSRHFGDQIELQIPDLIRRQKSERVPQKFIQLFTGNARRRRRGWRLWVGGGHPCHRSGLHEWR